jgi:hypothetical protein
MILEFRFMVITCFRLGLVRQFFASILKEEIDEIIPMESIKILYFLFHPLGLEAKKRKQRIFLIFFSLMVFFALPIFQFGDKDNTKNSTMQYKVLKKYQVLLTRCVNEMK